VGGVGRGETKVVSEVSTLPSVLHYAPFSC
jgi:hypothetical protein